MAADPSGTLTTSEPAWLVLIALADGPKHAREMSDDITRTSGQTPGPGTLYAAITALDAAKWIVPVPSADARRVYQITSTGAAALQEHLRQQTAALVSVRRPGLADA